MSASQSCVRLNQANQIFAGLNRTDCQNVVALYPVSVSHSLQFLSIRDRTKMPRSGKRNRGDFIGRDAIGVDHVATRMFGERQYSCCAPGRMPHCQSQLRSAATIESLRQVFEREIVNAHDDWTRTEWGRRKL